MNIGPPLKQLHEAETALAEDFRAIGERHSADQDVYRVCHALAEQCDRHARQLQPHAQRYGTDGPEGRQPAVFQSLFEMVRHRDYEVIGHEAEAGMLLLRDLRQLYVAAVDASIRWVIIGEAARAASDQELTDLVHECHTETEAQVEWLVARIKVAAPQALAD